MVNRIKSSVNTYYRQSDRVFSLRALLIICKKLANLARLYDNM